MGAGGRRPRRARPAPRGSAAREGVGAGARGRLLAAAVAVAAEPPRWVRHALGDRVPSTPRVRSSLGGAASRADARLLVAGDVDRARRRDAAAARAVDGRRPGRRAGSTWPPGAGASSARWRRAGAWPGRSPRAGPCATRRGRPTATGSPIAATTRSPSSPATGPGARVLAQPVRAVAPAWRPGAPHTLAWVGASGRVEVRDVDTGALVWRSPASVGAVRALAWSADGHRLLARGERRVVVLDVPATRSWRVRLPRGRRGSTPPRGRRAATASRWRCARARRRASTSRARRWCRAGRSSPRPGTLRSLAWSPDGRRLLVRWAEADQWLLLSPTTANARDHRHRRHLAPLRQHADRAGLVLRLS